MSANFGTLDLPVRRTNWKAVALVILSAMVLGTAVFRITQIAFHGSGSVTREAPAAVRGGIENPSLYAPAQVAAQAGGIENPSLYAPAQVAAQLGGIENPSLYAPAQVAAQADSYTCRVGKVGPC